MFKSEERGDRLEFAPRVVRRHGRIFAKILAAELMPSEIPGDVFGLTGVIEWPEGTVDDSPAQVRYWCLGEEILRRTLREAEDAIAEAFVRVAMDVIERERAKDR